MPPLAPPPPIDARVETEAHIRSALDALLTGQDSDAVREHLLEALDRLPTPGTA
jgi:hypothetical protein